MLPPLPDPIARWLRWQAAGNPGELAKPREPLVVPRDGARLVVRLISRGSCTALLLQEEHSSVPPGALRSLGLTRRETEVLAWVAEGKASSDIGRILGIGRRAVEKHLEHIYPKLGVETRTAAAARALALLSGLPASSIASAPKTAKSPSAGRTEARPPDPGRASRALPDRG